MKAFLLSLLLLLATPFPASAAEVVADELTDSYQISGAVLLNASYPQAQAASSCSNCHWRVLRICSAGSLEDRPACRGANCEITSQLAEVWRADAVIAPPVGDPLWNYQGTICLTEAPIPMASISAGIHDLAWRTVPVLAPSSQPRGSTLTGLPTFFRAGQPAHFVAAPASVAGVEVTVFAQPNWTWDFGQGPLFSTVDPGGWYPSGRVRHLYPKRGLFRVRVTCTWRATYSARGIANLPIDGVITQSAAFDLRVREARRYLHTKGV
ncbi:MAG: PKD domain-containing protein [Candidatus Nanopelagicales bacterium]